MGRELERSVLAERLRHFGVHLRAPIWLEADGTRERIDSAPPWRRELGSSAPDRAALLAYGEALLGESFIDAFPLRSETYGVDGVALVLGKSPHYGGRQRHRVYLRGMLLAEAADNILPDWAFFVRCVIDAQHLEPNASREALRDGELLERTREQLGATLKAYWRGLAESRPDRLRALIELHALSVRALALDDDELYQLVVDALPFETSLGTMTLAQCRQRAPTLHYVTSLPGFRQMAPIAAAQGLLLLNAAYTYDAELLAKAPALLGVSTAPFAANDLAAELGEATREERRGLWPLLELASELLGSQGVDVALKRFAPEEQPVLLCQSDESVFLAAAQRTRAMSDALFEELLDDVVLKPARDVARPVACFNARNSIVQRLAQVEDRELASRVVELLYAQAVLQTQRGLRAGELSMLNRGLMGLLAAQLSSASTLH